MLARLASLVVLAALALALAWPATMGDAVWRLRPRCYWAENVSFEVGYARASVACFWNP